MKICKSKTRPHQCPASPLPPLPVSRGCEDAIRSVLAARVQPEESQYPCAAGALLAVWVERWLPDTLYVRINYLTSGHSGQGWTEYRRINSMNAETKLETITARASLWKSFPQNFCHLPNCLSMFIIYQIKLLETFQNNKTKKFTGHYQQGAVKNRHSTATGHQPMGTLNSLCPL